MFFVKQREKDIEVFVIFGLSRYVCVAHTKIYWTKQKKIHKQHFIKKKKSCVDKQANNKHANTSKYNTWIEKILMTERIMVVNFHSIRSILSFLSFFFHRIVCSLRARLVFWQKFSFFSCHFIFNVIAVLPLKFIYLGSRIFGVNRRRTNSITYTMYKGNKMWQNC